VPERAVLLVEDNPDDELLTLRALQRHRVTNPVFIARDGVEALEFMFGEGQYVHRDGQDLPAVIMLDLKLPKLDGLEVLRRLRNDERTCLVPIVVLSTSSEEKDIINSYTLGANSFVRKPVDFEQFTEAVWRIGTYWLKVNEALPDTGSIRVPPGCMEWPGRHNSLTS
jgi:two-component system response regulator